MIARNWRCQYGEVDLIAALPGLVVFCEVKARRSAGFGGPEGAVDWRKQRRLRRLAAVWLAEQHPGWVEIRFDVASVVGAKIQVIMAAF